MAVFLPSFLENVSELAMSAVDRNYHFMENTKPVYKAINLNYLFANREDAYTFYRIMKQACDQMPKKRLDFDPIIFPWYSAYVSKTQFIIRMCVTAYALQDDNLIDDACTYISSIDGLRSMYLELLTHDIKTAKQRKTLLEAIADKESDTRSCALRLIKRLTLTNEEICQLEGYLKYKNSDMRRNVLTILNQQSVTMRLESARHLICGDNLELRMGGLSILQELKKDTNFLNNEAQRQEFDQILNELNLKTGLTENETDIISDLCGKGKASKVLEEKGYGLYLPEKKFKFNKRETHYEKFKDYFNVTAKQLDEAFSNLENFYQAHGMLEYESYDGETRLLCNSFTSLKTERDTPTQDCFPFKELWIEFYATYITEPRMLRLMHIALCDPECETIEKEQIYSKNQKNYLEVL